MKRAWKACVRGVLLVGLLAGIGIAQSSVVPPEEGTEEDYTLLLGAWEVAGYRMTIREHRDSLWRNIPLGCSSGPYRLP
ncbi:MAG: hypothetical protein NUV94_07490 [Candidatus Acetothermia bacterium]|nr:hypothetical protein [Candidatus Acetothermia bacterium]